MSEKKKKQNIFLRVGKGVAHRFVEVRQEMKRVIWPTKEKLLQVTAVVLVVIVAAAIILSVVSQGSKYILGKVGFYVQVTPVPTPVPTTAVTTETTAAAVTTDAAGTTVAVETTAA